MSFLETWRWYGPNDPVGLSDIRQAGAKGVVTALHHIPNGDVWPVEEIRKRQKELEDFSLPWSVVESIPVHEEIKQRTGDFTRYIQNYRLTLINLSACGIDTVCYNFMPVLDWTRTDLAFPIEDGSLALRFDEIALAAFDMHMLKREEARTDYKTEVIDKANSFFKELTTSQQKKLERSIIKGLPGSEEGYELDLFRGALRAYEDMDPKRLKENLFYFLKEIIPVAEEVGIKLAIHPDDPPFSLFGLPRIVSTEQDIAEILMTIDSSSNGLTFCSGSLGVIPENDLGRIIRRFGDKIHFAHLRNVQREQDRSFHEADHLTGNVDMYEIVSALIKLGKDRLPMRPDHGHQMLDDLKKNVNPGYSGIGRLRGLAELRGLTLGISKTFGS